MRMEFVFRLQLPYLDFVLTVEYLFTVDNMENTETNFRILLLEAAY